MRCCQRYRPENFETKKPDDAEDASSVSSDSAKKDLHDVENGKVNNAFAE